MIGSWHYITRFPAYACYQFAIRRLYFLREQYLWYSKKKTVEEDSSEQLLEVWIALAQFPISSFWLLVHVHEEDDWYESVAYLLYLYFYSQEYGKKTSVLGKLRMRKQNTNKTVPLDAVPERRTERCSPRFRPGGRFCELRFRYQSSPTGSEGEISRPLDHVRQIPFIHSTRFFSISNFDIYNAAFRLFPPCGTF